MLPPIPRDVYELYDGLRFWERWHVRIRWRLCPFLQIAGHIPPEGRIVDIGCGRGMLANYLALTGSRRRVTGIDRQEPRINAAQASIKGRENIRFRLRDALELEREEFDVIILSDMLHHLPRPGQEQLLEHCFRILPDDGLLLLEDVTPDPKWKWVIHFLVDRTLNLGRRQYFRSLSEWTALLQKIGFAPEHFPAHRSIPLPDFLLKCRKAGRDE